MSVVMAVYAVSTVMECMHAVKRVSNVIVITNAVYI